MHKAASERGIAHTRRVALVVGLGLYVAWTLVTWVLEGRIRTFLRPDAATDRMVYALVGNLLVGIVAGMACIAHFTRAGSMDPESAGLGDARRTALAVVLAFVLGFGLFVVQGPPTTHPVVMLNVYSQVFVVSAAEVVVCWCVVGASAEAVLGKGWAGTMMAGVVAAVLFGLYHFAHSAPFNTWSMVGLLTVVGWVTGTFFFLSRDAIGTVVFHNFLGMFGALQALAKANALAAFEQVQPALVGTAVFAAAALLALQVAVRRRSTRGLEHA